MKCYAIITETVIYNTGDQVSLNSAFHALFNVNNILKGHMNNPIRK